MQITPLEAVRAIAAIANGGKLMKPTLVKDAPIEGESIAVDPAALQVVREGMRKGVTEGTSVDRKSTRLNSSHLKLSRMPSSA